MGLSKRDVKEIPFYSQKHLVLIDKVCSHLILKDYSCNILRYVGRKKLKAGIVEDADLIGKLYVLLKRVFFSVSRFCYPTNDFQTFIPECHMKEFVDFDPQYIYTYGNTHTNTHTCKD